MVLYSFCKWKSLCIYKSVGVCVCVYIYIYVCVFVQKCLYGCECMYNYIMVILAENELGDVSSEQSCLFFFLH